MSTLYPIYRNSAILTDPFDMLSTFDKLFDDSWQPRNKKSRQSGYPLANVMKSSEGYHIEMAVPGYSRDEFEMSAENNLLTVMLNTTDSPEEKQKHYQQKEWNYNSFSRAWSLPEGSNIEGINARYEAGILYIDIPVNMEKPYTRTINVE